MGMNTKELGDRQNDLFAELSALPFEQLFEEKKRLWKELGLGGNSVDDSPEAVFERVLRYLMISRMVYQDLYTSSCDRQEREGNYKTMMYYFELTQPRSGYLIGRYCQKVADDLFDNGDQRMAGRWKRISDSVMGLLIGGLQKGKTS